MLLHSFSGLIVPEVPLEETELLRKEAVKNNIELVCLSLRLSICLFFLLIFMSIPLNKNLKTWIFMDGICFILL